MKGDTYKEVKIFEYDGATVRVHIPDLTPEEHQKRMALIEDAARGLLIAAQKAKRST